MRSIIMSTLVGAFPPLFSFFLSFKRGNRISTNLQTRVAMMTHQAVQQQSPVGRSSFFFCRQHRKME